MHESIVFCSVCTMSSVRKSTFTISSPDEFLVIMFKFLFIKSSTEGACQPVYIFLEGTQWSQSTRLMAGPTLLLGAQWSQSTRLMAGPALLLGAQWSQSTRLMAGPTLLLGAQWSQSTRLMAGPALLSLLLGAHQQLVYWLSSTQAR